MNIVSKIVGSVEKMSEVFKVVNALLKAFEAFINELKSDTNES